MENKKAILSQINPSRITENLWRLVNIPSPTGQERQAALCFAEMLAEAGAEIQIDETIPGSPGIIGRLKGNSKGKTIQLSGHIDHINIPHSAPTQTAERITGRGAADMKNGLAGILEIIHVLKSTGCQFPGEIRK